MIKVVERLRELERILRNVRRFAGSDGPFDRALPAFDAAEQLPEIFGLQLLRKRLRRENRLKSGSAPPRSANFRRMFPARTAAYCTYGPVSPSKLSAS